MKGSLKMGSKIGKENGKKLLKLLVVQLMNILVNIKMIRSVDKESLNGQVEITIKESIRMMKEMDMEKCSGLMAADI
jgi:hypothetical protein